MIFITCPRSAWRRWFHMQHPSFRLEASQRFTQFTKHFLFACDSILGAETLVSASTPLRRLKWRNLLFMMKLLYILSFAWHRARFRLIREGSTCLLIQTFMSLKFLVGQKSPIAVWDQRLMVASIVHLGSKSSIAVPYHDLIKSCSMSFFISRGSFQHCPEVSPSLLSAKRSL